MGRQTELKEFLIQPEQLNLGTVYPVGTKVVHRRTKDEILWYRDKEIGTIAALFVNEKCNLIYEINWREDSNLLPYVHHTSVMPVQELIDAVDSIHDALRSVDEWIDVLSHKP